MGKKALEPLARNVVCLLLLWDENKLILKSIVCACVFIFNEYYSIMLQT